MCIRHFLSIAMLLLSVGVIASSLGAGLMSRIGDPL
jgi:hypothetical protein